jgi:hypothetical protein
MKRNGIDLTIRLLYGDNAVRREGNLFFAGNIMKETDLYRREPCQRRLSSLFRKNNFMADFAYTELCVACFPSPARILLENL